MESGYYCIKLYRRYKRICKAFMQEVECTNEKIRSMDKIELTDYLDGVRKRYFQSKSCYELREQYRDVCVIEEERDYGHEKAIDISRQVSKVCENTLHAIAHRYKELDDKVIENLESSTSLPVEEQKKKTSPRKKKGKKSPQNKQVKEEDLSDLFEQCTLKDSCDDEEGDTFERMVLNVKQMFLDKVNEWNMNTENKMQLDHVDMFLQYFLYSLNFDMQTLTMEGLTDLKKYVENMTKLDLVKIAVRLTKSRLFLFSLDPKREYTINPKRYDYMYINLQYDSMILPIICYSNIKVSTFLATMQVKLRYNHPLLGHSKLRLKFDRERDDKKLMKEEFKHEETIPIYFSNIDDAASALSNLFTTLPTNELRERINSWNMRTEVDLGYRLDVSMKGKPEEFKRYMTDFLKRILMNALNELNSIYKIGKSLEGKT